MQYREEKSFPHYYNVVIESPLPQTDRQCFWYNSNDISDIQSPRSSKNHNESLLLGLHSSLICFKIALCVLL